MSRTQCNEWFKCFKGGRMYNTCVEIIPGTRETSHKRGSAKKKTFVCVTLKIKVFICQGIAKRKIGPAVEWSSHTLILRFFAYVKQNPVHHLPYDFNPRGTKPHYVLLAFSVGKHPRPHTHVSQTNHAPTITAAVTKCLSPNMRSWPI